MGQQQLLLLVLGIVIVGLATVVGINAYGENSIKSNWDALLQDGMRIASDAQSWKQKPELFDGSEDDTKGDLDDFDELDFNDMGYTGSVVTSGGLCYTNLNGSFEITPTSSGLTIEGISASNLNVIQLLVDGILTENIVLQKDAGESVRGGIDLGTGDPVGASVPCNAAP